MAAGWLRRAPHTVAQLAERLRAKGYSSTAVTTTVARCRELRWVDDAALAHDRARALRFRGSGSLRIAADLEARGLPESLIAEAVETSLEGEREAVWARRVLERAGTADPRRAWRLLASRGFPEDVISELTGQPD